MPATNTDSSRPANVARVEVYAFTGPATVSDSRRSETGNEGGDDCRQGAARSRRHLRSGRPGAIRGGHRTAGRRGSGSGGRRPGTGKVDGVACRRARLARRRPYERTSASALRRKGVEVSHRDARLCRSRRRRRHRRSRTSPTRRRRLRFHGRRDLRMAYNVYEVTESSETQLTKSPTSETQYADARMTWGATRCYAVRSVEMVERLAVESEATPPACVTLADTFPPARAERAAGGGDRRRDQPDLGREHRDRSRRIHPVAGRRSGGELAPITPAPIRETAFQDRVPAGVRYIYAVKAVDKAGNAQPAVRRASRKRRGKLESAFGRLRAS